MNLYLISQSENNDYDTYDSAVVCAKDEDEAKMIHPNTSVTERWYEDDSPSSSWVNRLDSVSVQLIGKAHKDIKKGVVLASFNAG